MPPHPATQQDIENLRNELRDHAAKQEGWNRDHSSEDRMDFKELREEIALIKESQAGWNSGLKIITWMLGLGFAAVLSLLGAVVAKHL